MTGPGLTLLPIRLRALGRSGTFWIGIVLLPLISGSWSHPPQVPPSVLERYDLSSGSGKRVTLPRVLEEISGLATTPDGRLFAHHDERGVAYEVDWESGRVIKAFTVGVVGLPGDFEGIAVAGDRFFLVTSGGQLVEFREGDPGAAVRYRLHPTGLGRVCEMEGLAFDTHTRSLLLPCKNTRAGHFDEYLVVYSVPLESMVPDPTPRILLPLEELDDRGLGDKFHPSAIAVHPETRSLIITGASDEALVEISPTGQLLAVEEMKKKDHPQPEGLAFLPDGSLVIADEGQGNRGRITRYSLADEGTGGGS